MRIVPTERERDLATRLFALLDGCTFDEANMIVGIVQGKLNERKDDLLEKAVIRIGAANA